MDYGVGTRKQRVDDQKDARIVDPKNNVTYGIISLYRAHQCRYKCQIK